jgi:hypothetical protein
MFANSQRRIRSLEAEMRRIQVARVNRLEREVEAARSDSRTRERVQAVEAAGLS